MMKNWDDKLRWNTNMKNYDGKLKWKTMMNNYNKTTTMKH